jgi:predicted dehydrogenase
LHLPALQRLPEAHIVAAADIDPDRLGRTADRYEIARRYSDFRALLEDAAVDAVAVCVPPHFHAEIALAALDAEKHVFIEKPLAVSLEECDRLLRRAARSQRKVMVGFNLRWHRLVRRARDMVAQGTLGHPELICSAFTSGIRSGLHLSEWRDRRELGGGVLSELATHHFDLWRYLVQSEVEEVFAISRSGQRDDETGAVMGRMTNGVLAASVFSERTNDSNELEIHGQSGCLRVSCYRFDGLEFVPTSSLPGGFRNRLRKIAESLKELPYAAVQTYWGGYFLSTYREEWRHFLNCILHDRPVESTLEDGRRALQVSLAAMASASHGQPVRVGQAPLQATPVARGQRTEVQQE